MCTCACVCVCVCVYLCVSVDGGRSHLCGSGDKLVSPVDFPLVWIRPASYLDIYFQVKLLHVSGFGPILSHCLVHHDSCLLCVFICEMEAKEQHKHTQLCEYRYV